MQFRKSKAAIGLGILFAAIFVWILAQGNRATPQTSSIPSTERNAGPELASTGADLSFAQVKSTSPLPPLDLPVTDIFHDLKRRADQGDARASCRLAVELINCNQLESLAQVGYMENSKAAERDLEESGLLTAANSVATQQIRQLESLKLCAGISENQRKLAGDYLLQAANAGIPEAMIRYAEGQSIAPVDSMFGMLQDKGFDQWRHDAAGLLEKALEQGEPAAVFVLYMAYSDNNSLIGGLIADDPLKAYSYRLLMNRLRAKNDTPPSKLSPQQMAEAGRAAARMHAEYFENRVLREPDAFSSLMTPAWARPEGVVPRRPCE